MSKDEKNSYQLIRSVPVEEDYDLLVAGGGPAGSAAAICAARLGAKVLLVEATGCLGGMGTSGLVCAWNPMADGEKMLVGGFMRELVETQYERGLLRPGIDPNTWRKNFCAWTPFNPEGLKAILDEKAVESGVEVRFFTKVIDVNVDSMTRNVNGAIISNVEGYSYIKAKAFIDCTGDAVLSALCGVEYHEAGRDTENIMASTLASLYSGFKSEEPRLKTQSAEVVELIEKEYKEGNFTQCDRHIPGIGAIGKHSGCLNGGHIFNMNALKVGELSGGMMLGRRIVREYERFLKKYSPDCKDMELISTGSVMGVRESRNIVGEYVMSIDDHKNRRKFPDQIAVYTNFVDIHPYDCSEEEFNRFKSEHSGPGWMEPGESFGIPYGVLVPRGWRNLWVAGRCASSDVQVQGAIRVMPACSMMGQAAGTAAVQSINTGQPSCDLDVSQLVDTLRKNNAYLPQEETFQTMTRSY